MFLFCVEVSGNHSAGGTVKDEPRHVRLGSDGCQVVFLAFFVLAAEFAFGAFHQSILAGSSQRVERLHTIDGNFATEDVLNVHYVEVLPIENRLQRV